MLGIQISLKTDVLIQHFLEIMGKWLIILHYMMHFIVWNKTMQESMVVSFLNTKQHQTIANNTNTRDRIVDQ